MNSNRPVNTSPLKSSVDSNLSNGNVPFRLTLFTPPSYPIANRIVTPFGKKDDEDNILDFFKQGLFDKAKENYINLSNSHDNKLKLNAMHNYAVGLKIYLKAYQEAIDCLNQALDLTNAVDFPNHDVRKQYQSSLNTEKGRCFRELNNFENAEECFKNAISLCHENTRAHISYGVLFQHLKKYPEAEKKYLEAIQLDPKYDSGYVNYAALLNDLYETDGNTRHLYQAIILLDKALVINYKNIFAHTKRINTFLLLGDFDNAYNGLFELECLSPGNPDICFLYARYYFFTQQYSQARAYYTELLSYNKNDLVAILDLGVIELIEKNYATSKKLFEDALSIDPDCFGALLNISAIHINQREYEEALAVMEKMTGYNALSDENIANLYLQTGLIMAAFGFDDEAELAYQRSLELAKSNRTKFSGHLSCGLSCFNQKKYAEALQQFRSAKSIHRNKTIDQLIEESESSLNNPTISDSSEKAPRSSKSINRDIYSELETHIQFKSSDANDASKKSREIDGVRYYPSLIEEDIHRGNKKYYVLYKGDDGLWYKKKSISLSVKIATGNILYDFVVLKENGENKILMGNHGHDNLSKGEPVIFAGKICIKEGKVRLWTNCSGHYKPFDNSIEISKMTGLPQDKFKPRFTIFSRLKAMLDKLKLQREIDNLPKFAESLAELTDSNKKTAGSLMRL